jgi:hypothetical protein
MEDLISSLTINRRSCQAIVWPDRVNQAVDELIRRGVRIEIYKTITKPAILAADVCYLISDLLLFLGVIRMRKPVKDLYPEL